MIVVLSHKVLGGLVSCKSLSMMSIVAFYPAKEFKNNVLWMRNSVFDILCLKYQWNCQGASWSNSSGTQERRLAWKHKSERQACLSFPCVGRLPWESQHRVKCDPGWDPRNTITKVRQSKRVHEEEEETQWKTGRCNRRQRNFSTKSHRCQKNSYIKEEESPALGNYKVLARRQLQQSSEG